MEVNRRTVSPDFAAGEAQFFRKLKAAVADLQAQCENEKVSNQRSFERNRQAIQQRIHDLELKRSDLARRKRELEDAGREAALELQKIRDEEIQGQKAHHDSEERRRRKYSALLRGGPAANLRIFLAPRLHQDQNQSLVAETGQLSDNGPGSLRSANGQETIQAVLSLRDGRSPLSGGLDTRMTDKTEQHFVESASNAARPQTQNSAGAQDSHEQSSEEVRGITAADERHHTDQCHQTLNTTEVRQGKRKRFPTAKAQALGLSDLITTSSKKRRALTPRQAESSPGNRLRVQEDRTPDREPQISKHSVIETGRHANNEVEKAQTDPLSETNVQGNICDAPLAICSRVSAKVHVADSGATANQQDVASSSTEQVPGGRTSRPQGSTALHESPIMTGRGNFGEHTEDIRQSVQGDDYQSHTVTQATEDALTRQPHYLSRFEPALPGAVHANTAHKEPGNDKPSQMDGAESLGFGVIDVADIGLKLPKVSEVSGNAEHPYPLTDAANAGNPALIELASRTLKTQNIAAARSPQNLESIARQARDSWQVTEPESVQTSPEDAPQPPGSSTSSLTELSLRSTEDSTHAGSSSSSQSATVRPRGPSALRPLNFGQLQRDSRKTLHDFEGEFFKVARKPCGLSVPTTDRKIDESSHQRLPANRSAGGRDWTRSSSVREPKGLCQSRPASIAEGRKRNATGRNRAVEIA